VRGRRSPFEHSPSGLETASRGRAVPAAPKLFQCTTQPAVVHAADMRRSRPSHPARRRRLACSRIAPLRRRDLLGRGHLAGGDQFDHSGARPPCSPSHTPPSPRASGAGVCRAGPRDCRRWPSGREAAGPPWRRSSSPGRCRRSPDRPRGARTAADEAHEVRGLVDLADQA
jgi:hypothetical protein